MGVDVGDQLLTPDAGQAHVGDQDVDVVVLEVFEALHAVDAGVHVEGFVLDVGLDQLPGVGIVFDNEHGEVHCRSNCGNKATK